MQLACPRSALWPISDRSSTNSEPILRRKVTSTTSASSSVKLPRPSRRTPKNLRFLMTANIDRGTTGVTRELMVSQGHHGIDSGCQLEESRYAAIVFDLRKRVPSTGRFVRYHHLLSRGCLCQEEPAKGQVRIGAPTSKARCGKGQRVVTPAWTALTGGAGVPTM
jgi:hypothetical protein